VNATPTVPYQQRSPPANSPVGELPRQQASSTYRDDVSALLHQHRRVKPSRRGGGVLALWGCGGGAGCECSVSWCTADSSKAESGALWWHLPGTVCPLHARRATATIGGSAGCGGLHQCGRTLVCSRRAASLTADWVSAMLRERSAVVGDGDGGWVGGYAGRATGEAVGGAGGGWVAGGRSGVFEGLRRGALGGRQCRCAGAAAGAETGDHR
jgi:hypothetical protein